MVSFFYNCYFRFLLWKGEGLGGGGGGAGFYPFEIFFGGRSVDTSAISF